MKIIGIPLVPSRYGEPDRWTSDDESIKTVPGRWIELAMRCRYTRKVERLSILYTGPEGTVRVTQGGPEVPGPHGSLIPQAGAVSAHPTAKPTYIDVTEGDVLVLNGQPMVIADDRLMAYPQLITEAEWGLLAAQRVLRDTIATCNNDDARLALGQALVDITMQADTLRTRSHPTSDTTT